MTYGICSIKFRLEDNNQPSKIMERYMLYSIVRVIYCKLILNNIPLFVSVSIGIQLIEVTLYSVFNQVEHVKISPFPLVFEISISLI